MFLPALSMSLAAAAVQQDVEIVEQSDILEFRYSWPAEADAVPGLRALLSQDMTEARLQSLRWAREDQRVPRPGMSEFNPHWYEKAWEVQGETRHLISLSAADSRFIGGAHPNHGFSALLWAREASRSIDAQAALGTGLLRRLTPRYCQALDAERAEKRGGEPQEREENDPFSACPPLADQVIVPVDNDENGRFDMLRILIPPYVAGPYVEGNYEIDLPLDAAELTEIPCRYGEDFESAASSDVGAEE